MKRGVGDDPVPRFIRKLQYSESAPRILRQLSVSCGGEDDGGSLAVQ
jgi:hypothetical protein